MTWVPMRNGGGNAIMRILAFFIATHLGRMIAGLVFLTGGLVSGFSSHSVNYQQGALDYNPGWLSLKEAAYYLPMEGHSGSYLVIKIDDFTPLPNFVDHPVEPDTFKNVIYRTDGKQFEQYASDTNKVTGTGYQVVAFTLIARDGTEQKYTTAAFRQNPNGFYENNWWPVGITATVIGLIFFALTLGVFVWDKRYMERSLAGTDQEISF